MKTAIVTGASSGIGLEIAKALKNDGYNLLLIARNEDALKSACLELGEGARYLALDLTQAHSFDKILESVGGDHVDLLVNNAGVGDASLFEGENIEKITQIISLNVLALTKLTKIMLAKLIESRGSIINIASVVGFFPNPFMAVYSATKAYVLSFSQALALELSGRVNVITVCPGATDTSFVKSASIKNDSFFKGPLSQSAKEVAKFTLQALKSKKVVAVSGVINKVFAHAGRLMPLWAQRKLNFLIGKNLSR